MGLGASQVVMQDDETVCVSSVPCHAWASHLRAANPLCVPHM